MRWWTCYQFMRNILLMKMGSVQLLSLTVKIINNKKILLANLSSWKIWSSNARLLWWIFISKIKIAAMLQEDIRKDFFLYLDEFQYFATETFWEILPEARRYKLAFIMAHQYIGQIWWNREKNYDTSSIKNALFWNIWTLISFKIWEEDSIYLEKAYAPYISSQHLMNIQKFETYIKLPTKNGETKILNMKTLYDDIYKN